MAPCWSPGSNADRKPRGSSRHYLGQDTRKDELEKAIVQGRGHGGGGYVNAASFEVYRPRRKSYARRPVVHAIGLSEGDLAGASGLGSPRGFAPVVLGLTVKAVRGRLIPWWYAAVLYVAIVPTFVSTVRAPNQIPPGIQNGQRNGVRIALAVLGRPPSHLLDPPPANH